MVFRFIFKIQKANRQIIPIAGLLRISYKTASPFKPSEIHQRWSDVALARSRTLLKFNAFAKPLTSIKFAFVCYDNPILHYTSNKNVSGGVEFVSSAHVLCFGAVTHRTYAR